MPARPAAPERVDSHSAPGVSIASRLPSLEIERRFQELGYRSVAGVDEAGRGPLAGPVVAAAVLLHDGSRLPGVADSKLLSPAQRVRLFPLIFREARAVGVGVASHRVIDRINILRATHLAMARAAARLGAPIDLLLVDGRDLPRVPMQTHAVIGGDRQSLSIAAASIVAKVTRDVLMGVFDREYPGYGFASHKGYPTSEHRDAIRRLGSSPIHRLSFRLLGDSRA
ncbi:MAG: ribonuclease HII [bacterium]